MIKVLSLPLHETNLVNYSLKKEIIKVTNFIIITILCSMHKI